MHTLITQLKDEILQWIDSIYGFFFEPQDARKPALFRIIFGSFLLLTELIYAPHIKEFFTDEGFFKAQFVESLSPLKYSLFFYIHSYPAVLALYILLLLATTCFILGIYSRIFIFIVYILFNSFQARNPYLFAGGDILDRILIFLALFMETDQAFVLPWFRKKKKLKSQVSGWPIRLVQIQIAIIYFWAFYYKLHFSEQWYNGTFVFGNMNDINRVIGSNFYWLRNWPVLVNIMTYGGLFTEMSFPFLVWFKQTRWIVLLFGISLHGVLIAKIDVSYFGEIMLSTYILFLDNQQFKKLFNYLSIVYEDVRKNSLIFKLIKFKSTKA